MTFTRLNIKKELCAVPIRIIYFMSKSLSARGVSTVHESIVKTNQVVDETVDNKECKNEKAPSINYLRLVYGGERGIRTLGRVAPTHTFQACSFSHSDSSPNEARIV